MQIQIHRNQLRIQSHGLQNGFFIEMSRKRVDGTERPEKVSIGGDNGNGDVTFKLVDPRRVVQRINWMPACMLEDDRLSLLPNLMADGCFQIQLATRNEAEINGVVHCASNPVAVSYTCDGSETHACRLLDHFQDQGDCFDSGDNVDIAHDTCREWIALWELAVSHQ